MKKEDLKSTLGKIRPRESLVDYTIAKMHMEKEKQERQSAVFFPSFMYNKGVKLAGAFCVFALIVGICLTALNGGFIAPNDTYAAPTLSDKVMARSPDIEPATYSLFDDEGKGWILASGHFNKCVYTFDREKYPELAGALVITFSVSELHSYSDTLSVDIKKTPADIIVCADFGDAEYADEFIQTMTDLTMIIRATPNDDGSWTLLGYSEMYEE